ncbi:MAG TPA: hypothetical protein VJJ27_01250 [Candidatus Paceibacterota bacterium]
MKKLMMSALGFALPMLALAQGSPNLSNFQQLVDSVGRLIATALPILVALALLFFFYGLAKFILAAGNEESKAEGRRIMVWGIVALFVMVSIWGLVAFLGSALGISQGQSLPDVPGVRGVNR